MKQGEAIQTDGATVIWWTFAGGRINQTLKYAIEWKGGFKVVPDNFALKIQGNGLSVDAVHRLFEEFRAAGFWADEETRRKLRAMVPEYRLSKFQSLLPDKWQTELVGEYMLDFDGAAAFVREGISAIIDA